MEKEKRKRRESRSTWSDVLYEAMPARLRLFYTILSSPTLFSARLLLAILFGFRLGRYNFLGVTLDDKDMSGARLRGVSMSSASMWKIKFRGADLVDADMTDASMWYAKLEGADLRYARLVRADMYNSKLAHVNLAGSDLAFANLCDAELNYAILTGANLCGTNLLRASLEGACFKGSCVFMARGVFAVPVVWREDNCWHHDWLVVHREPDGQFLAWTQRNERFVPFDEFELELEQRFGCSLGKHPYTDAIAYACKWIESHDPV